MGSGSPIAGRPDEDADGRRLFGLFSLLISSSLILHRLWVDGFELGGLHFAVVVAAFWALVRPTSVGRFLVVAGLEVVSIAIDLPNVGDHTLLVGVIVACALAFAAVRAAGDRRLPDPGDLFTRLAPLVRAAVIVLYATAALDKMNTTFLDPDLSCAGLMTPGVVWFDRSLLDAAWLVTPAIVSTVLIEASLPILLALRRTRTAGLVVGIGFHLVLALAGNIPFAAVILALYVAFLPADLPSRAIGALAGTRTRARLHAAAGASSRTRLLAFAALLSVWLTGALITAVDPGLGDALVDNGSRLIIVVAIACAAALALRIRSVRKPPRSSRPAGATLRLGSPIFAVGLALLILNGLSPYLGLKTATTFNMFSNLRTEPGRWNHAFVPEAVQVFGYQDDLVRRNAAGLSATHLSDNQLVDRVARFQTIPETDGDPSC